MQYLRNINQRIRIVVKFQIACTNKEMKVEQQYQFTPNVFVTGSDSLKSLLSQVNAVHVTSLFLGDE